MKTPGMETIESALGPPGATPPAVPKAEPDPNEADEGGETEIVTHLRAMMKAERNGNMQDAAAAFEAAVRACNGSSYTDME